MQRATEEIHVSDAIADYAVRIVAATRAHASVQVGASPRGSLALFKLARCHAALRGREYVIPDDVKAIAVPALAAPHRCSSRARGSRGSPPEEDRGRGARGSRDAGLAVTRRSSPRIAAYAALAGLGLLLALALGRADLAVLAAPFAAFAALAAASPARPSDQGHLLALHPTA